MYEAFQYAHNISDDEIVFGSEPMRTRQLVPHWVDEKPEPVGEQN